MLNHDTPSLFPRSEKPRKPWRRPARFRSTQLGSVLLASVAIFLVPLRSAAAPPAVGATAQPVRPINAAWRAILITGLTADKEQAARLKKQADALRLAFQARGLAPGAIQIVNATPETLVTRETVLSALQPASQPSEETWIVLLGQIALNRAGQPAFQVSGPRLTAEEFAIAVGTLPGKKFVIVGTARSGGFLPALEPLPDVEAVAATGETGEINEPRFVTAWAEALTAQPDASFMTLTTATAARVEKFYEQKKLGQGEHARVIDRDTKTIIDVPVPTPPSAEKPAPASH